MPEPTDDLPLAVWRAVDLADQALYVAKHSGRNRVEVVPVLGEQPASV
jgi:GGDEF domain-containing protein